MYIESIAIESFGSYKNFACSFDKGINIIEGPNEAGKTTLGAFIKFIFYGLSRKASQGSSIAEARRFRSWDNDLAAGSLTFSYGDKRYRIERSLKQSVKALGGESVKIIDLATNTECFKGEHPGRLFFGVEEDAFVQSAYVGQSEGGKINGKTVNAAIENMLFSGDETVSTASAQKKLDEARVLLKYKVRRGGKISDLEDKIDLLVRRRENARSDNKILLGKENEKKELCEKYEKEKRALEIIEKQLERSVEKEKLDRFNYYDSLCEKALQSEKEYNALIEKSSHESFLPSEEYISKIETLRTQLGYLYTQSKQNEDDKAALGDGKMSEYDRALINKVNEDGGIDTLKENIKKLCSKRKGLLAAGIILLVLGAASLAASIFCFVGAKSPILGLSPMLAGVCALVVSVALFASSAFMIVFASANLKRIREILDRYSAISFSEIEERYAASSKRHYQQSVYDEKLSSLLEKGKKIEDETERLEGDMKDLFTLWGKEYESLESAAGIVSKARECIKQISEVSSESSKAISARDAFGRTLEELDREKIASFLEESVSYGDIEQGSEMAVKLDFERRSAENAETYDEIRLLELDIARLSATAEDPTILSDEIESLTKEKAGYELCYEAYMLANESISNATEKLRTEVAPVLAMNASAMMGKETSGKYSQLGVSDDLSLAFGTDTGSVGNIVTRDIDFLSEGTKDLAYISLRVALVSLLFTKAKPPMIFDESFARLDDTRLESTLSALGEVASSGVQMFVLTSQTRDAKIMEKVGSAKHIML